jgi:ATP-dependent DNA helicase RecG
VANSNHVLSTQEVVALHLQSFNTSWDYHTNNQFSINDISLEKVENAITRINQAGGNITDDAISFLKRPTLSGAS